MRTGGDFQKSLSDYLQEIDGRSGTAYQGRLTPHQDGTDPRKPKTNLDDWLPESIKSATEEVNELLDEIGRLPEEAPEFAPITFEQVEAAKSRGEKWALDIVWTQDELDAAKDTRRITSNSIDWA